MLWYCWSLRGWPLGREAVSFHRIWLIVSVICPSHPQFHAAFFDRVFPPSYWSLEKSFRLLVEAIWRISLTTGHFVCVTLNSMVISIDPLDWHKVLCRCILAKVRYEIVNPKWIKRSLFFMFDCPLSWFCQLSWVSSFFKLFIVFSCLFKVFFAILSSQTPNVPPQQLLSFFYFFSER